MRVTCEKTQVKTFHEKQRQEMHLLRGGGSSRSKRRVDIFLHLNFTFFLSPWLDFQKPPSIYCLIFQWLLEETWWKQDTFRYTPSLHITNERSKGRSLQASKQYWIYACFLLSIFRLLFFQIFFKLSRVDLTFSYFSSQKLSWCHIDNGLDRKLRTR